MDRWDQIKNSYIPEVKISTDGIEVGVFKPSVLSNGKSYPGYGTILPSLSYTEAKELYRALRKTLIKYKRCTDKY